MAKDENSPDHFSASRIVPYFLLMGVCYLSGLVIYVYQCPERFKPGKFDIWVNFNFSIGRLIIFKGIEPSIMAFNDYYCNYFHLLWKFGGLSWKD